MWGMVRVMVENMQMWWEGQEDSEEKGKGT